MVLRHLGTRQQTPPGQRQIIGIDIRQSLGQRALERLLAAIAVLEKVGATPWANRATSELNTVRKLVTRMGVVSRTDFLAPGYALLETLTALVIGLLLVARFKYPLAEGLLVGFVTLIFVYMVRLIRDIDGPFEYTQDGQAGASEVELFPLTEYRARLEAKLAALPAEVTAPAVD